MLTFLSSFAHNTWDLVAEMAPYLLFGFAFAGLLHVFIRQDFVQRWLGKPGLDGVIKASLLGVPMPLCSCAVIPVAASLRKSGATRGATASFLSSTPQTGVDSILATYALLGGLFTTVRVTVAFITGIVTGYLIELFCKTSSTQQTQTKPQAFEALSFAPPMETPAPKLASLSKSQADAPKSCCASKQTNHTNKPVAALRYAFVTLPSDLASALILGLLLAGLITTLMPTDLLSGSLSSGPLAFLLATAISLPLYVCATASIPMAYALMAAGLSPGAALVFLIAGPATNTATIVTVWKMLGRKATTIYLTSLLVISWLAGWLFNTALSGEAAEHAMHMHGNMRPSLWHHASGLLLIGLLCFSVWKSRRSKARSCCAG
ncbi:SO_0444 family Cu/Zn efflux transporter [Coraliomargarita sp. SDUM461004]|uniref:SO_0444 family Cu/Zn efflux transporter n=1 Tax=Thalassobacterium sedimentorum TaxID=3041258 RepID=A0ABU1AMH8_9BACT|nr:SO_0444 family Cu/Zn efflux transporter [Coraliomargarita sp. SDUM461004]MDQ8195907.1 SO_0444 family Cu/Zn efflux transporter [Coraliomargarita sp. SDUM461004]